MMGDFYEIHRAEVAALRPGRDPDGRHKIQRFSVQYHSIRIKPPIVYCMKPIIIAIVGAARPTCRKFLQREMNIPMSRPPRPQRPGEDRKIISLSIARPATTPGYADLPPGSEYFSLKKQMPCSGFALMS